ncbi:hypothetical protein SD15574_1071 [Shigella dysenteriae 155-74]|nr:hypothetical protein Sd1012_1615 [Shigella dysenteriae 1012]EGJ01454.1 hypothetical protein SD15574_1071 [Shigella dysenteriae 155-74]EIQ34056.1 hypothetical protein SB96558_0931 [Shigella boydii 965-58]EJL19093.1 hypothetical protein SSMOSELEY_0976 [Shigella sonnei str. Moseley]
MLTHEINIHAHPLSVVEKSYILAPSGEPFLGFVDVTDGRSIL